MRAPFASALLSTVLFAAAAHAQAVFDLADAVGMGNGTLPGTGIEYRYPINNRGLFLPDANPFIDATFVPLDTGPTQIDTAGGSYDFSSSIGGGGQTGAINDGSPGNGRGGLGTSNDPSGRGGNPDYLGRPNFHSLMAAHSNVGITFDLVQIRQEQTFSYLGPLLFSAKVGSSCSSINYFVLVDGVLAATGGNLAGNNFDQLFVPIPPTARFLTLATGDDDTGTINCKHGYFGDPFLTPCGGGAWSRFGSGCPDSAGQPPDLEFVGAACLGRTFFLGGTVASGAPAFVAVGLSDQIFGNLTLPFDLSTIGAGPGCFLLASQEAVIGPVPSGSQIMISVPNNAGLVGAPLFHQVVVLDPNLTTSLGVAVSDGLRLAITR